MSPERILYACRTLGVPDHDRCNALARERQVLCLVWPRNTDYVWDAPGPARFEALEAAPARPGVLGWAGAAWRFWRAALRFRPRVALVYGYQDPVLLVLAVMLRARGSIVLSMNDSKFDDYGRRVLREALKALFLVPYQGILAATPRAADYVRFLGRGRVELYACAIDTGRVAAAARQAFAATPFAERDFLVVARFVAKKNHMALLDLYEAYLARAPSPRRLRLVGYGELEAAVAARVAGSDALQRFVRIEGYRPAAEMPAVMAGALALLLPSIEEQFGIVVTEALACGIPVILSPACGATLLVEDFVTGFVVDPANAEGWIEALERMGDEAAWRRMSARCPAAARRADTRVFVAALGRLAAAVEGRTQPRGRLKQRRSRS
ncbi:MAG TPA: glycosyltransferase [Amaricoccus sp.]|nr:glycosyltransferase [Amaricoccus sp.]